MSTPDTDIKTGRILGSKALGAIILYLIAISALLTSIYTFKVERPQIEAIKVNYSSSSLEITGKHLNSAIRATALYNASPYSNVVAEKFMWERVFDVKIKGSIAWALCRNVGLIALDISNPHQPQIVRTVHINKFLWHLNIKGNTAYIACGKDGVVVCDVTSPASAKILSIHKSPHPSTDVTAAHNHIYVSSGKHGISIVDSITKKTLGRLNQPGVALRLHATQDRLFVFSTHDEQGLLHIYALQENPAQPKLLQQIQFPGVPRDYVFKDHKLYLANGRAGVGIVDLPEKGEATFAQTLKTSLRSHRLALRGEQLVIFSRTGEMALYSIEPNGVKFNHTVDLHSSVFGADMFGHYTILATNTDGIKIVDLNPPPQPLPIPLIAQLPLRAKYTNWHISAAGISIWDAKTLYFLTPMPDKSIKQTGKLTYPTALFSKAHTVYNSRIYAAIQNSGLHVAKIASGGSLEAGKTVPLPQQEQISVYASEGHNDKLYLCTSKGLKVFDISNPDHPVYKPEEDVAGNIRNITFGGGFAYTSSYGEGIKIHPIKRNNKLGPAKTIDLPHHLIPGGRTFDLAYVDGFLFAACGYRGLLSVDVRKPHQPVIMDSIEIPGYCSKVELNQGILGVKSLDSVFLLDIQNPEQIHMLGEIENVKDFHIGDSEMLYLQHKGVLQVPLPEVLPLTQKSSTKLIFQLPANIHKGSYNLFLNLNNKRSQRIGRLTNTPSGAAASGWEFTPSPPI